MKNKKPDLELRISEIFSDRPSLTGLKVVVEKEPENSLKITISKMYSYVDISYDTLTALSKVLGTKKINVGERDFVSGCETCDHGSQYWVEIYAKNVSLSLIS